MSCPVVMWEIEVLDPARAREFYAAMFGWDVKVIPGAPGEYGFIDPSPQGEPVQGAISGVPDQPSTTWRGKRRDEGHTGQVTIFVRVPDVEAALARAQELGGTRMLGPDDVGMGITIGRFLDPQGHLIGVMTSA